MEKGIVAVVGLGYVGLPVACSFAAQGYKAIGIDIDDEKVRCINSGTNPIEGNEPGLNELMADTHAKGLLSATADPSALARADAIFVCVDTPVDDAHNAILRSLEAACRSIGQHMRKGTLLSIESTIPPGTMERLVIPTIAEGRGLRPGHDYLLVHCPERVMPGRLLRNIQEYDRVLGGFDERSCEVGIRYYKEIVEGDILPTSLINAEITKTTENAYRDVQIAFANEIALLCERLGANAFEVRELVNSCPFRDMHIPGSGVGGYCLPKDPWLLLSSVEGNSAKVIPAAREVNESMPMHMVELVRTALKGSMAKGRKKVSIMGLAFLRDSDDTRNSPALKIIDSLRDECDLIVHDPFVRDPYYAEMTRDVKEALMGSDCAVFVTDHSVYKELRMEDLSVMRTACIVDGRNIFSAKEAVSKGVAYLGIGKGNRTSTQ